MDRITRVIIRNARAIAAVDLDLSEGLTVLIGENGSGKSTIIECLELLRKASEPQFFNELYQAHRGLFGILRKGETRLTLGICIDSAADGPLEYRFELARKGAGVVVHSETLFEGVGNDQRVILERKGGNAMEYDHAHGKPRYVQSHSVHPERLLLSRFGMDSPEPTIRRMIACLAGIEVHVGFDTVPTWAAQTNGQGSTLRSTTLLRPAPRLALLGRNLVNAWSSLRNTDQEHWEHTLALVRLGLGDGIDTVIITPDAGGGNVALQVRKRGLAEPIDAADLSDGQLAWLAFIALARLNTGRSLLVVDEPERHLHPSLLSRVMALLQDERLPVLLSTHSDRVLELLDNPEAVRVCALEDGEASVHALDPARLQDWLDDFGDLGSLRRSGFLHRTLLQDGGGES